VLPPGPYADFIRWLASQTRSEPADAKLNAPTAVAPEPRTGFTGTLPFGVDSSGRVVFFYLATVPWTEDFRRFLHRQAAILRLTAAWTLRLVFPRPIDGAYEAYETVIREEFETPLQPATIRELKRDFERRRAAGDGGLRTVGDGLLNTGAQTFAGPRFAHLYRRWLKHGDATFEAVSSGATAEALRREPGGRSVSSSRTRIDISAPSCTESIRHREGLRTGTRGTRHRPTSVRGTQPEYQRNHSCAMDRAPAFLKGPSISSRGFSARKRPTVDGDASDVNRKELCHDVVILHGKMTTSWQPVSISGF
jgi:hypothetical protein